MTLSRSSSPPSGPASGRPKDRLRRGPVRPDTATAARYGEDYLALDDAREGMQVVVDGGFTCMTEGDEKTIARNDDGELFIPCAEGTHALVGQLQEDGTLIGIFPLDGALCK